MKNYLINNNDNNRGDKKDDKKTFDFKACKKNTIKSLHEVEFFLNNFSHTVKYIKLIKLLK